MLVLFFLQYDVIHHMWAEKQKTVVLFLLVSAVFYFALVTVLLKQLYGAMDIVHFFKSALAHPPVLQYQLYDLCMYYALMTKCKVSFVQIHVHELATFFPHFYSQTTTKLLFSHLDQTFIIWPIELSFFFFFSARLANQDPGFALSCQLAEQVV